MEAQAVPVAKDMVGAEQGQEMGRMVGRFITQTKQ